LNSPSHDNIDYWFFDWVEGNLTAEQEEQLQLFLLLNPEYEAEAEAWKASKVSFPLSPELQKSFEQIPRQPKTVSQKKNIVWWLGKLAIPSMIFLFWNAENSHFLQNPASGKVSTLLQVQQSDITPSTVQLGVKNNLAILPKVHNLAKMEINPLNKSEVTTLQPEDAEMHDNSAGEFAPLQLDKINYKLNSIQLVQSLIGVNALPEESASQNQGAKHRNTWHLNWSFNKTNALTKFLKKESVNATQKDRLYVSQERSHLDINEGFSGNSSQAKLQSTTFLRGMLSSQPRIQQQISFDAYQRTMKSGFGLVANYTKFQQGTIQDWNVRTLYSPKIALSRYITIEPSVSFIFGQKLLDIDKVTNQQAYTFESMVVQQFNYDMSLPIGRSLFYRDINAGLLVNLGPLYVGGQMQNVFMHQDNIHTNDFSNIARSRQQTTLIAGTDFTARRGQIRFSPQLIHEFSAAFKRTQLGGTFVYKNFAIGGNYGFNQSLTGMVGIHAKSVSILYQGTRSSSLLSEQKHYLHQISLRFSSKVSRKSRRYISL